MSTWNDPQEWARLRSREGCPICREGGPRSVAAELEASWVTMEEGAALPGTCALFFRRHAVELHELSAGEGAAYMRDLQRLSRALLAVTGAIKMNCEMHGNTIPHLHTHFFPRYPGDPFAGGPIDPRAVQRPAYAPGEFERMRQRLLSALASQAGGEG